MLMVAVDPGGQGDVSKTHVRYRRTKPAPLCADADRLRDNLFLWSDHGVVCCMNPLTGKDVWTKRIGGDFSASPIARGNAVQHGRGRRRDCPVGIGEFKPLGKIALGDPSNSRRRSPTAGSIFVRFTI